MSNEPKRMMINTMGDDTGPSGGAEGVPRQSGLAGIAGGMAGMMNI